MKTIFITVSRGGIARNVLQNDFFKILKSSGERIVILTPAYRDERFLKEFGAENVFFEPLYNREWTFCDRILVGLDKGLVYNDTTIRNDKFGMYDMKKGGNFKYFIKKIIFKPLSRMGFVKEMVRWVDKKLVRDCYYEEIFQKYKPDLVFATSVMEEKDVFVIKQAQRLNVPVIGMPKSWDNFSKSLLRAKTDKVIVWGEYSQNEAKKFQNFKTEDIFVAGSSQFDFYRQPEFLMSKEDIFNKLGLDTGKKLVVYGSEGPKILNTDDEVEVISALVEFMESGEAKHQFQLVIRPHLAFRNDAERFKKFFGVKNVVVDNFFTPQAVFKDNWDYSREQTRHLTSLMTHADLIITATSTLTLDASVARTPAINFCFDGLKSRPLGKSIKRWYEFNEHYKHVLKTGAPVLAHSLEELKEKINFCLSNPDYKQKEREELVRYMSYKDDGEAGKRMAGYILNYLNQQKPNKAI